MRCLLLTAVAGAACFAVPAMAQDTQSDPTFTGPRVEAVAGWDHFGNDRAGTKDGVVYGGAVGYDAAMSGFVVGAEAELTGASTSARAPNVLIGGDSSRLKPNRDIYVGARVGTIVSPGALLYVKAGYTNLRVNERYTAGATTTTSHQSLDGFRVGAGGELAMGGGVYLKAEYRYSKYSSYDRFPNIRPSRNQVVAGVGLRF